LFSIKYYTYILAPLFNHTNCSDFRKGRHSCSVSAKLVMAFGSQDTHIDSTPDSLHLLGIGFDLFMKKYDAAVLRFRVAFFLSPAYEGK
jgi:hypothetical protein